jgi:predicted DsbA family dithiol-disulfide isomerase
MTRITQAAPFCERWLDVPSGAARMHPVKVTYFTDPLCCWSWALEPHWRRLRDEFAGQLTWRYRMGGMIADWQSFADPLNAVRTPAHVGPHWFYVRETTGVPLDERLWVEDPPESSYPACVAFKAAELQGADAAERYLRRLREAAMCERRNPARRDVVLALAGEAGLDSVRFERDLDDAPALEAFREDLKETRYRGIGRFPTLVLQRAGARGLMLIGYRPYDVLRSAVLHLAGHPRGESASFQS